MSRETEKIEINIYDTKIVLLKECSRIRDEKDMSNV